jgi:hypothetical protein
MKTRVWRPLLLFFLVFHFPVFTEEPPDERAKKAGTVLELQGFRLLRIHHPSAHERGFAHGFLLAPQILETFDAALTSLPGFSRRDFNERLTPWVREKLAWERTAKEEIAGLLEGLRARLGEKGSAPQALGRPLNANDFLALNAIADWFGPGCSGFSAWGKRTADDGSLHARTLDFPLGPKGVSVQLLFAFCAREKNPLEKEPAAAKTRTLSWVGVGWPGMIGCYTGMNERGLTACMHDGYNLPPDGRRENLAVRSMALRRLLETTDPFAADPVAAVQTQLRAQPASCGNLFQLTWPEAAAKKWKAAPSVVWEWDNVSLPRDAFASPRGPDQGEEILVLTNHFCVRREPAACRRFKGLREALRKPETAALTAELAQRVLIAAEQSTAAHTVIFEPDRLRLHVSLTHRNVMSTRVSMKTFAFAELTGNEDGK